MKTKEFTRKDGTTGIEYKAEVGDSVIANYETPQENTNQGNYTNYSLGVEFSGQPIYLKLSEGQYKGLITWLTKNPDKTLLNRTITFEEYKNQYGKQIGTRVGDVVERTKTEE